MILAKLSFVLLFLHFFLIVVIYFFRSRMLLYELRVEKLRMMNDHFCLLLECPLHFFNGHARKVIDQLSLEELLHSGCFKLHHRTKVFQEVVADECVACVKQDGKHELKAPEAAVLDRQIQLRLSILVLEYHELHDSAEPGLSERRLCEASGSLLI